MPRSVNKEKIITIAVGLAAGILVTGGYFAFQKIMPNLRRKPDQIITRPQPNESGTRSAQVSGASDIFLSLDQPDDHISTSESGLAVSGKTIPSAAVVFFCNGVEKITSAGAAGNLRRNIKLEDGENEISITAFLNKINSVVVRRNVTLEISQ